MSLTDTMVARIVELSARVVELERENAWMGQEYAAQLARCQKAMTELAAKLAEARRGRT